MVFIGRIRSGVVLLSVSPGVATKIKKFLYSDLKDLKLPAATEIE